MTIARIENGEIVEYREMDLTDVPEHKREAWRPVEIVGEGRVETVTIEANRVTITRSPPVADVPRT